MIQKLFPFVALAFLACCNYSNQSQPDYTVSSPDGKLDIHVQSDEQLNWAVTFNGKPILLRSPLSIDFVDAPPLGKDLEVLATMNTAYADSLTPLYGRHKRVLNKCNELILQLREKRFPYRMLSVIFRAYDDGVAFRWFIPKQMGKNDMVISEERSTFRFPNDCQSWKANYGSFLTHQEAEFFPGRLSEIGTSQCIGLPILIKTSDDIYAAITESNLTDWSGMYLCLDKVYPDGSIQLRSNLSPEKGEMNGTRKVAFTGPHYSPWRILMVADAPGRLIESEIVYQLAEPTKELDFSWVKPGKCAWDHWWSGDVQMNTATLKQYIDLASEMGFPYQLIDWQWYGPFNTPTSNITKVNPAVNMPEVLKYAKKKNVRCWVWLYWTDAEKMFEKAFPLYEKWGIAGVKIDFMARDDQYMVNWYEKIVKKAAECHLMVNFHGAYKPTGMERTWPNLMTREGVMGNEYNKWSERVTPEHDVTLPFTRGLAGPMDYTPGGFLNAAKGHFRPGNPTMVMGTRCHELAKFVVFYSPITTVCDHPDNYKSQPGIEFLKEVPTVWDDTRVLSSIPGEYIVMARRSGNRWFLAAMTNSYARDLKIRLDFLGSGEYSILQFSDAPDCDTEATHLIKEQKPLSSTGEFMIKMAPGGGYVAIFEKVKK